MKGKLLLIGSGVLLTLLIAMHHAHSQEPAIKKVHEKVKAYMIENVHPTIAEERALFDNELSADEIAKVEELRTRADALKEEGKEFRQLHRRNHGEGQFERPNLTDEQKDALFEHKKQMRLIRTEAYEIIDAHEDYLRDLHEKLEPQMKEWHAEIKELIGEDMEAIRSKHQDRGEGMRHGRRHYGGGKHGFGPGHGGMRMGKMHSPVKFLLMDPDNPKFLNEEFETLAYPNPASSEQTLELDLQKSGSVKVDLYDAEGNFIKTLFQGELSKGNQNINLKLGDLSNQQYVYKIYTPSGVESKRVIIK